MSKPTCIPNLKFLGPLGAVYSLGDSDGGKRPQIAKFTRFTGRSS